MLNILTGFLGIKRLQQKQHEIEMAYLDADLNLARIESELIKLERIEVQPHLVREFAMQRACSKAGLPTKSTEDCIKMARLWARMN